jgi:L-asparaginase
MESVGLSIALASRSGVLRALIPVSFAPMDTPPPITVITTGGTIDKLYFDSLSEYKVGESVVRKLLAIGNVKYPFDIIEALRKDSLELTDADRDELYRCVAGLKTSRVVMTHGTDTMAVTAARLASIEGKTIVLTGALSPARFSESDASFNLGMAFATAQVAPRGVFIVMNGEVFPAGSVRKDWKAGRFVRIS